MPSIKQSTLVVVDVQGKLAQLMHEKEDLFKNIGILIKASKLLEIPIIWCQQVPEALGETAREIKELLDGLEPVNKASFSCCGSEQFAKKLSRTGRNSVILCGIETHVCIYQTAVDLKNKEFDVTVIADGVSSRTAENKQIAIEKLRQNGIDIASTEMVLFELLKTAEHPKFREIAGLIR